jgi:hypothetical protein
VWPGRGEGLEEVKWDVQGTEWGLYRAVIKVTDGHAAWLIVPGKIRIHVGITLMGIARRIFLKSIQVPQTVLDCAVVVGCSVLVVSNNDEQKTITYIPS